MQPEWIPHTKAKGQWHGALMYSLICVWINAWVNNCEAGDLRCHRTHYEIIVMRAKSNAVGNPKMNSTVCVRINSSIQWLQHIHKYRWNLNWNAILKVMWRLLSFMVNSRTNPDQITQSHVLLECTKANLQWGKYVFSCETHDNIDFQLFRNHTPKWILNPHTFHIKTISIVWEKSMCNSG